MGTAEKKGQKPHRPRGLKGLRSGVADLGSTQGSSLSSWVGRLLSVTSPASAWVTWV